MQFPSWREKVRKFFEPYDKKNKNKKVETQKSVSGSTMTQNKGVDIYKDGTIMLFPTNPSSTSEWYLTRESNPNSIPTFSTHIHNNYNNKIVRKTEGNQSYWTIKVESLHIEVTMKKAVPVDSICFQVRTGRSMIAFSNKTRIYWKFKGSEKSGNYFCWSPS